VTAPRRAIVAVILSAAVITGAFLFVVMSLSFIMGMPSAAQDTTVEIRRGASLGVIAAELREAGVLKNPVAFTLYARAMRLDRKVRSGEYEFSKGMTGREVLKKLVKGESKLYKITLIEGWTARQMAKHLAAKPFVPPDFEKDFVSAAYDKFFAASLGIDAGGLEGFLSPNTYLIERPRSAGWLVAYLVEQFNRLWTPAFELRAQELGMSKLQIVTLASIIEKESGVDSERPLISSVFHNRLKIDMPLQTDPTVIYGLKNYDGNIRKSDLRNPHAYNTYVRRGLPPGPIANPALSSIKAALWPAESSHLYFVAKGDGSGAHTFSSTLSEHNAAVRDYLANLRKNKN